MPKPNPATHSAREEPELTQEESVPTDGRDIEGERLMKDVSNRKLQEKGEAEHKTPQNADVPPETTLEKRRGNQDSG
ncbi:hypothetical protein [Variovorax sp. Root411]|uniref:hypothetical protein n=1 Tax=Variovorax sp. Root411 TaxID=1736530 RepID=UPI0006FA90A6|nr:hypothetical protein [Variovorax sp. Root411]KQW54147.1 hypothetical protein ASC92_22720 [Variovorax sp. Root411]